MVLHASLEMHFTRRHRPIDHHLMGEISVAAVEEKAAAVMKFLRQQMI
jgi:hypothetical protein